MFTWSEARDIEMTLAGGHCRGIRKLLEELGSERAKKDIDTAESAARLPARVTEVIHKAGIPLFDR